MAAASSDDADMAAVMSHIMQADMREPGAWVDAFSGVDSVVHLQAWNPYPEASWEDSRL